MNTNNNDKIMQKISNFQKVGNNVIKKMIPSTSYYRRIDSLEWLKWTEINIQEQTDESIIIRNASIDYSKVLNPSYGRVSLPLRMFTFSDRDFAKYVRLLVKVSLNRRKVIDSFYAEQEIKRLQVSLDHQINLLKNKDRNYKTAQNLAHSVKENYSDFVLPDFVQTM